MLLRTMQRRKDCEIMAMSDSFDQIPLQKLIDLYHYHHHQTSKHENNEPPKYMKDLLSFANYALSSRSFIVIT